MDNSTLVTLCLIGVGLLMVGSHIRRRSLRNRPPPLRPRLPRPRERGRTESGDVRQDVRLFDERLPNFSTS
jgi:hypothetical protein